MVNRIMVVLPPIVIRFNIILDEVLVGIIIRFNILRVEIVVGINTYDMLMLEKLVLFREDLD